MYQDTQHLARSATFTRH